MGNRFASGKYAIAQCDRCDQRYMLKQLRREVIKTKNYELLVCPECWDPDQPQLQLGMYPVDDPQGLMNPRPDRSYRLSGTSGLQVEVGSGPLGTGTVEAGSRIFQWGWNPVGGSSFFTANETPNNLVLAVNLGTVSVGVT
jgi:hypothetical protein